MLEKMGWSKGKGLGAQEQGATEHIKVQVKNNHLGLGATVNNEDNWIAHQDDFNQLLAELNSCHGQETADSSDNKEKKSFSLEKKSKVSKSRVHYMKFTKGKDLSSRSKTDLDCIFGKRQNKKTHEDESHPATPDGHVPSSTTTSAFTIQEYFAQRMAELKSKAQGSAAGPSPSETQLGRKKAKKRKKTDENVETHTHPQAKVKKKREQVESPPGDPREADSAEAAAAAGDDGAWPAEDQDLPQKPRNRRGKTPLHRQAQAAVEAPLEETLVKKKKKKKKGAK
ncbi:PIN2/TERF1-interacting telomerase inhibitor 1 isoform X2 [Talpa occidentalis]|nr:PIN2/TERF1-interacting telomerase inhibitor 1 isoform X2 [Talpa occidentalis]